MKNMWYQESDSFDSVFGLRLNIIERKVEGFLKKLKDANIKMIFPFHKNFIAANDLTEDYTKEEENYSNALEILDKIDEYGTATDLKNLFNHNYSWFPRFPAIHLMLFDIAKKYGTLVGSPSLSQKASDHEMLATKIDAHAILANDSFYLLHQSKWKYWATEDLDFENTTVSEYDKDQILRHLGLDYHQMPMFVALTDSNLLDMRYKKQLRYHFKPIEPNETLFKNVANFISRRVQYPLSNGTLDDISREIFRNRNTAESFFIIMKKILDSFKIKV
jgi:hypothetical protein